MIFGLTKEEFEKLKKLQLEYNLRQSRMIEMMGDSKSLPPPTETNKVYEERKE